MASQNETLRAALVAYLEKRQQVWLSQLESFEEHLRQLSQQLKQPPSVRESDLQALNESLGLGGHAVSEVLSNLSRSTERISAQTTEEEILVTLLEEAVRYGERAVLFLCSGDRLSAWKIAAPGASTDGIEGVSMSASTDTPVGDAYRHARVVAGPSSVHRESKVLLQALGGNQSPGYVTAIPLSVGKKIPAVLYVDGASEKRVPLGALELLCQMTVQSLKFLILSGRAEAPRAAAQPPAERPFEPVSAGVRAEPAAPRPLVPETPAQDQFAAELDRDVPSLDADMLQHLEVASDEEARAGVLESELVEPPAPVAEKPVREPETIKRPVAPPLAPEMEKFHADARRFARLLVSELKLYNEQAVVEGRRSEDVYRRLRHDIDRSRDMYEKRVHPDVATQADYFHEEIVRILGDGMPSTLGSDYPGIQLRRF